MFGRAIYAIGFTASLQVWPMIIELKRSLAGYGEQQETNEEMEFVQIPPQINQQARLNATFIVRFDPATDNGPLHSRGASNAIPFWRPAEWENPIWGWVLINHASHGIQVFFQDGTFYREIRLFGEHGRNNPSARLPFASYDKEPATPEHTQLERLVARLGNEDFQRDFCGMIGRATENMAPVPDNFSDFTNTLIGRPLALTHAGWSLELAGPLLTIQGLGDTASADSLNGHEFNVKIGNPSPGFDGLVCVFNCAQNLEPGKSKDLGLSLDKIFSDFDHDRKPDVTNGGSDRGSTPNLTIPPLVLPIEQISLKAFDISPESGMSLGPGAHAHNRNVKLQVRGLLLDPFKPVHTSTAILPVWELLLSEWTWQGALEKMRAFFHMGPIIVTKDVPTAPEKDHKLPNVDSKLGQQLVTLPDLAGGD